MKSHLTILFAAMLLGACSSESQSTAAAEGADATAAGDTASVAEPAEPTESAADMSDAATPLPEGSLYSHSVQSLSGETVDLSAYAGKVTLIVNVASECGYTRQYEGLQKLHEELGGDKFALLAFPSNDFGGQEPGSPEEIQAFCSSKFGVTFDMFAKVPVKAAGGSPVYDQLAEMTGQRPSWNFCKFVVSADGTKAKFFKSGTEPGSEELREAIESMMD